MRTTPFTITVQIAEALGLTNPRSYMLDAMQLERCKAVAEIVYSFMNYTEKHDKGLQGLFAEMIIRILQTRCEGVHFSDMQTVINIIQKGDEAIQEEMRSEREEWLTARKAENELATA
jgi:hypothetical protein